MNLPVPQRQGDVLAVRELEGHGAVLRREGRAAARVVGAGGGVGARVLGVDGSIVFHFHRASTDDHPVAFLSATTATMPVSHAIPMCVGATTSPEGGSTAPATTGTLGCM
jgi:hypothetical protein